MYVCLCTGVTEGDIRKAIQEGACSVSEVARCSGAGTRCGSCISTIASMVADEPNAEPASTPTVRRLRLVPAIP